MPAPRFQGIVAVDADLAVLELQVEIGLPDRELPQPASCEHGQRSEAIRFQPRQVIGKGALVADRPLHPEQRGEPGIRVLQVWIPMGKHGVDPAGELDTGGPLVHVDVKPKSPVGAAHPRRSEAGERCLEPDAHEPDGGQPLSGPTDPGQGLNMLFRQRIGPVVLEAQHRAVAGVEETPGPRVQRVLGQLEDVHPLVVQRGVQ